MSKINDDQNGNSLKKKIKTIENLKRFSNRDLMNINTEIDSIQRDNIFAEFSYLNDSLFKSTAYRLFQGSRKIN